MRYAKYIKYAYITAVVVALIYFAPSILHLLLPFILALIVAAPFHKIVERLETKLHIHRGISSAVIFTLIIGVVLGLVALLLYYIISQFRSFMELVPDMIESARVTVVSYYEKYRKYFPAVADFIDKNIGSVESYTPKLKDSAIAYATDFATSIPSALFFILIFFLSVFFFIKDYNSVMNFFREALPEKVVLKLKYIKDTAWRGFVGYIKSQLILSSITALLVAVTFWVLGIDYAVVWAIIVGVIDFIPILGSGIVLVPFAIIHFMINKNLFFAVCIIILQVVAFVVRQILSPRIMSSQLGLHPIITLVSIYVGNELMGVMGMVLFPILALLLVSLYTSYKNAGSFDKAIEESKK